MPNVIQTLSQAQNLNQGTWSCGAATLPTACQILLQNIQYKYVHNSCIPVGLPEGFGVLKQVEFHLWLETALLLIDSESDFLPD